MIDARQILDEIPPELQGPMTRRLLELRVAGRSIALTVRGAEDLAIDLGEDDDFAELFALVERIETTRLVRDGVAFFRAGGQGIDLNDALAELRRSHDCSV